MPIVYTRSSLDGSLKNDDISQDSTTVSTAYFYDDKGNRIECQVTESHDGTGMMITDDVVMHGDDIKATTIENVPVISDTTWTQPEVVVLSDVPLQPQVLVYPPEVPMQIEEPMEVPKVFPEKTFVKKQRPKAKPRLKKLKPAKVKRMKLDEDGEMVPDDSPPEAPEDPVLAVEDEQEIFVNSPQHFEVPEIQQFQVPVDENLNETKVFEQVFIPTTVYDNLQPSTSSAAPNAFDEEAFFNSLDMEKLFIVEAQRDGRDIFEIYGTDPITQEMCEKPMDLPQRYIDLIIKVMTQEDDDE